MSPNPIKNAYAFGPDPVPLFLFLKKSLMHVRNECPPDYHIDFEGDIPSGKYGAGRVLVWDKGSYMLLEKGENKVVFSLEGMKLKGNFALLRLKRGKKGNEWILVWQK